MINIQKLAPLFVEVTAKKSGKREFVNMLTVRSISEDGIIEFNGGAVLYAAEDANEIFGRIEDQLNGVTL